MRRAAEQVTVLTEKSGVVVDFDQMLDSDLRMESMAGLPADPVVRYPWGRMALTANANEETVEVDLDTSAGCGAP